MVEREECFALIPADDTAIMLAYHHELRAHLGVPLIIFNKGLAARQQVQRVDAIGKLRDHHIIFRQAEAVKIRRFQYRIRADQATLLLPILDGIHLEETLPSELSQVAHAHTLHKIVVWMCRTILSCYIVIETYDTKRIECMWIKCNRQGCLSHRHKLASNLIDAHIRVHHAGHCPLEQRLARVGGKLREGNSPFLHRGLIRIALQKLVGIRDVAVLEGEAVQHREAVKPAPESIW